MMDSPTPFRTLQLLVDVLIKSLCTLKAHPKLIYLYSNCGIRVRLVAVPINFHLKAINCSASGLQSRLLGRGTDSDQRGQILEAATSCHSLLYSEMFRITGWNYYNRMFQLNFGTIRTGLPMTTPSNNNHTEPHDWLDARSSHLMTEDK